MGNVISYDNVNVPYVSPQEVVLLYADQARGKVNDLCSGLEAWQVMAYSVGVTLLLVWLYNFLFHPRLSKSSWMTLKPGSYMYNSDEEDLVSWEPEGCYQYSKMFLWEPEGCYQCTMSLVIMPFWLSTDDMGVIMLNSNSNNDDICLIILIKYTPTTTNSKTTSDNKINTVAFNDHDNDTNYNSTWWKEK